MNTVAASTPDGVLESWEELRKQARALEQAIDAKLLNLNKLGTSLGVFGTSRQPENGSVVSSQTTFDALSFDIQGLLDQLVNVNDRLDVFARDSSYTCKPACVHTLQRHKEILQDYLNEYKRTQSSIRGQLEREMLMSTSSDVCKIDMLHDGLNNRRSDLLLKEHDHIKSSHSLLDSQIDLAVKTKEGLFGQQKTFNAISKKINALTKRYPAVYSLIQKIQYRKRRDAMIIAFVISIGLILMFLYSFS